MGEGFSHWLWSSELEDALWIPRSGTGSSDSTEKALLRCQWQQEELSDDRASDSQFTAQRCHEGLGAKPQSNFGIVLSISAT